MKKVGIIGGSGFIGSHVTRKYLEKGFQVRVSSTDINNTEKYKHLKNLPNAENLEVQALNVNNQEQVEAFVKDCHVIIHGGTPFQLDVKDPKTELFDPTVEGTKNFLGAVYQNQTIEKVIFLASVASYNTNFPMPAGNKNPNDTFDENDIPFMSNESHPYGQAKFIANQTVNKFIKDHPNINFEITSVSPVFVVGKSLSNREDSTSNGLQFLFKNKIAPNPFIQMLFDTDVEFALVDVKDVAEGIYSASLKKGIHGKNYILSSETWKVSDISSMLNQQDPKGSAKIIYKNEAAKNDLDLTFKPAVFPLNEFSN